MNKNLQAEATVIGAGVAGCCAAIALRRAGVDVLLLEKSSRRPHRFCGEFVSGEAATSLGELGVYDEVMRRGPSRVRRMVLYGRGGRPYLLPLAEEGLGLSRRAMDSALLEQAAKLGARVQEGAFVESVSPASGGGYEVSVSSESPRKRAVIRSRVVIGAQGKRSNLDRVLGRKFLVERSPYVGVKCHFAGMDPCDSVELYLFPGGYCGVVGIEDERTNICLLATERALRRNGGRPGKLIEAARRENPFLADSMRDASAFEDSLLTIGQVPFIPKEQVAKGVFMVGDSAGVMAPFLGAGVAGAMRSAVVCADLVAQAMKGKQTLRSAQLNYESWWRRHYRANQRWGHLASRLLCRPTVGEMGIEVLNRLPAVGALIYRQTRSRDSHRCAAAGSGAS